MLPGNIIITKKMKELQKKDFLQFIKKYQELYKQSKEIEAHE